jgi:hypothetical protein
VTGAVAVSAAAAAASAVRQGCVGETLAAVLAAEQLGHAQDPAVRAAPSAPAALLRSLRSVWTRKNTSRAAANSARAVSRVERRSRLGAAAVS